MKYRILGKTDLWVSEVGFGVWTVSDRSWGIEQPSDGVRLLQNAFDLGLNFFDTAGFYGHGYGEEIIPEAFGSHRHEIIVSTKFFSEIVKGINLLGPSHVLEEITPEEIRFSCEQSLRRLKSDYIDLYQIHISNPDSIFSDEILDMLKTLVKEGKARYCGVDFAPGMKMEKDFFVPLAANEISAIQLSFGIAGLKLEQELFGNHLGHNLGIITRNPHSVEMVPNLFWKARESKAVLINDPVFQSLAEQSVSSLSLKKLNFVTDHHPIPLTQLAITFCLDKPTVSSVLPDIMTDEQLVEYSSAVYCESPCSECVEELEELIFEREEKNQ